MMLFRATNLGNIAKLILKKVPIVKFSPLAVIHFPVNQLREFGVRSKTKI